MTTDPLFQSLIDALAHRPVDPAQPLLVAFSGGLDSSVLVDLLTRHRRQGGPPLELIHIDHGLRQNSGDDAHFCRQAAATLGLPLKVVPLGLAARGLRGQTAARKARLAAIADHALARGIPTVAFAHHGDDRLETFIFNLQRGTGLDGLAAMSICSHFPFPGCDLRAWRPLLNCSRADLEAYAQRRDLPFCQDPTNATDAYQRNRIRHHLLPHLGDDAPTRQAMARTLRNLESEQIAANHFAQQLAHQANLAGPGLRRTIFARQPLARAPQATVARLFHTLQPALDARSLHRIYHSITHPPSGSPHHLTLTGCVVTVTATRVVFQPSAKRGAKDVLQPHVQPIAIDPFEQGRAPFFDGLIRWRLLPPDHRPPPITPTSAWRALFDATKLPRPLHLTGPPKGARLLRQTGDGKFYHQKLAKLFSTHAVDADLRWRWPCLCDHQGQLIWAAGLSRGATATADHDAPRLWEITIPEVREWTTMRQRTTNL